MLLVGSYQLPGCIYPHRVHMLLAVITCCGPFRPVVERRTLIFLRCEGQPFNPASGQSFYCTFANSNQIIWSGIAFLAPNPLPWKLLHHLLDGGRSLWCYGVASATTWGIYCWESFADNSIYCSSHGLRSLQSPETRRQHRASAGGYHLSLYILQTTTKIHA